MEMAESIARIVLTGIGATLFMDASALIQAKGFGIASADYRFVGRWLGHMGQGRFRHASIVKAEPVAHERLAGWVFHYFTGCVFAMMLWAVQGQGWICSPSLLPALAAGLISVIAPFLIMQPAFGFGIAASKTPNPRAARRRSLIAHLTFGLGLFVAGWLSIQLFPAPLCLG